MRRLLTFLTALFCLTTTILPTAAGETVYTVGICQLVQHSALDDASLGCKDALTERLGDRRSDRLS